MTMDFIKLVGKNPSLILTIMKPLITAYVCCAEALYKTNGWTLLIPPVRRGLRLCV